MKTNDMINSKEIFTNIIPENIQNNETIMSLLKTYFTEIMKIDASKPIDLLDIGYIVKNLSVDAGNVVRQELLKIHLQEVFNTVGDISDEGSIYEKFKEIYVALNIPEEDFKLVSKIENAINSEYISASKTFKSKKGNKSGFFFIYDLVQKAGVQSFNTEEYFDLIEGTKENPNEPYYYRVESSLYKDIYDKTIVPLAHPLGFDYAFTRLLKIFFEDNYNYLERLELELLTLTCYVDTEDGKEIVVTDALDGTFGSYKKANIIKTPDTKEKFVVDFFPKDLYAIENEYDGIRLVRDFDGDITIYTRQDIVVNNYDCMDWGTGYGNANLNQTKSDIFTINEDCTGIEYPGEHLYMEITDIRLVNPTQGILSIIKETKTILGEEIEVVNTIGFKEYTIVDSDNVKVEYKIKGDKPDVWNTSYLPLTKKTISAEQKYYNKEYFNRKEILKYSIDYNGRILIEKGQECQLNKIVKYIYEIAVKDKELSTMLEKNIEDSWSLRQNFTEGAWYIGEYIKDPNTIPLFQEHIIGQDYRIGEFNSDMKMDYIQTNVPSWESTQYQNVLKPKFYVDSNNNYIEDGVNPENIEYTAWETLYTNIYKQFTKNCIAIDYIGIPIIGEVDIVDNHLDDINKCGTVFGDQQLFYINELYRAYNVDADPVNLQYNTKDDFSMVLSNTETEIFEEIDDEDDNFISVKSIMGNGVFYQFKKYPFYINMDFLSSPVNIGDDNIYTGLLNVDSIEYALPVLAEPWESVITFPDGIRINTIEETFNIKVYKNGILQ